jgi:hypothetical protein
MNKIKTNCSFKRNIFRRTQALTLKKGFLFDLFDSKGQFLDSFFINLEGYIVKIDADFLYSSESDEDGLPFVVKYRIMESLGS